MGFRGKQSLRQKTGRLQKSGLVNNYERVREEALVTGKGWTAMKSQPRSHTITKETQELAWPFKDVPSWGQAFAFSHQPIIGWRLSSGKGHTFGCRSLGRLLKRDTYVKCWNCCKRSLQIGEEGTVWFLSFFFFFQFVRVCFMNQNAVYLVEYSMWACEECIFCCCWMK